MEDYPSKKQSVIYRKKQRAVKKTALNHAAGSEPSKGKWRREQVIHRHMRLQPLHMDQRCEEDRIHGKSGICLLKRGLEEKNLSSAVSGGI